MRWHNQRKQWVQEAASTADIECTHQPRINKAPASAAERITLHGEAEGGAFNNTGERLYAQAVIEQRRRDKDAREATKSHEKTREERELEECTFQPKLTKRTMDLAAQAAGDRGSWRALHRDPGQQRGRMKQLAHEAAQREMQECSFQPRISERSAQLAMRRRATRGQTPPPQSPGSSSSMMGPSMVGHGGASFARGVPPSGPGQPGPHGAAGWTSADMTAVSVASGDGDLSGPDGGAAHDGLFQDAERRRSRRDEYSTWIDDGCTFQPNIGGNRHRPARDPSKQAFFERMHKANLARDERLDKRRRDVRAVDEITGQPLFKPVVGRGPNYARRAPAMPIGDFLHATRHQFDDIKSRLVAEDSRRMQAMRDKRFVNGRSEKLLGSMRRREARRIFASLVASCDRGDAEAKAAAATAAATAAAADGELGRGEKKGEDAAAAAGSLLATARADSSVLESEVRQVVGPLLEALAADNVTLSCDEFCTLLEGEIQHRRDGPQSSKLAPKKRNEAAEAHEEQQLREMTFRPKIAARSNALAREKGRGRVPIHEILEREAAAYEANKAVIRADVVTKELEECTFSPQFVAKGPARAAAARASRGMITGTSSSSSSSSSSAGNGVHDKAEASPRPSPAHGAATRLASRLAAAAADQSLEGARQASAVDAQDDVDPGAAADAKGDDEGAAPASSIQSQAGSTTSKLEEMRRKAGMGGGADSIDSLLSEVRQTLGRS